jgi:anti-sigma regulatory factor (Ser/Thr protein kinase)
MQSFTVTGGNRLNAHKLVHVRCRCKVGEGISLVVSDQGQGFDANSVPDPMAVENLSAEHGRGIHLMKSAMDEVWFERRGAEVHMWKEPSNDIRAKPNASNESASHAAKITLSTDASKWTDK